MSGPIGDVYVPSEGDPNCKLWLIGEAPGWNEEQELRPFVGDSGKILENVLSRAGVSRSEVFITNLCHYRPAGNRFEILLGSLRLQEGLKEISDLLVDYQPNVIAALGNYPLFYLTGQSGITKYRGSILAVAGGYVSTVREQKVIPTYHPAYIARPQGRGKYPIFGVDVQRIVDDSHFPELNLPEYNIIIDPPELDYWEQEILKLDYVTCDIENVKQRPDRILCVGFGLSDSTAVVVPWRDDLRTRTFIENVLGGRVRKVFQYGTHDVTCFRLNGIEVENYTDDTIVQAQVLQPELPRDLAYLASVETRQQPYKKEGRANIPGDIKGWSEKTDKQNLYIYNGKDCCVTNKIFGAQDKQLKENGQFAYYTYRMELQLACLDIGDSGLLVDTDRRDLIGNHIKRERAIFTLLFYKLSASKTNVGSNKQMCELLYKQMKLPERKKTTVDSKTGDKKQVLTADENAIVSLIGFCKGKVDDSKRESTKTEWIHKLESLNLVLKIREYDKLISSYIDVPLFSDGCARSCYKVAGTETGRLSNVKYVDDSGFNVQTAPRFSLRIEET